MIQRIVPILLIVLWCVVGAWAVPLANVPDIDVSIKTPPDSKMKPLGYRAYTFHISNHSQQDRIVELIVSDGRNVMEITRRVRVGAGASLSVPVYQPHANTGLFRISVTILVDGKPGGEMSVNIASNWLGEGIPVLVSGNVADFEQVWNRLFSDFKNLSLGTNTVLVGSNGIAKFVPAIQYDPIESWSLDWLSYTAYGAIILTQDEWQSCPPPVKQAITRYLETGGTVIVVGVDGELAADQNQSRKDYQGLVKGYGRGFGTLLAVRQAAPEQWSNDTWGILARNWEASAQHWKAIEPMEKKQMESFMPVVENLRVPIGGLYSLILIFAVVAGPVNIWGFARKEKRMRIYWTVPLFSIVVTVLIVLVSLFSEGIHSRVRTASLVFLNENDHRAAIMSQVGYYCPFPPRQLKFSEDIQLSSLLTRVKNPLMTEAISRRIDFSDGQYFEGWIPSRVTEYFTSRSSRACRDRISVRYDSNGSQGVSAVNGLSGSIEELWVSDRDGHLWTGSDMAQGASKDLTAAALLKTNRKKTLRDHYEVAVWNQTDVSNGDVVMSWLAVPGHYVAQLKENPYAEVGFDDYQLTHSHCIVFGILKDTFKEGGQ